jgi:hypothetical protein
MVGWADRRAVTRRLLAAVVAAGLLAGSIAHGPRARAVSSSATVTIDRAALGPAVNGDLGGFNWRTGGGVIAPLHPHVVRSFAVRLASISPRPDVYDFRAADAEVDAIEQTGATPMLVIIERPTWSSKAGSSGYQEAIAGVLRHFAVERPAGGHIQPWFESGNEPEFPPTSHGEMPWELQADVRAQVHALLEVEHWVGRRFVYGGPGALFADPAVAAAFVTVARKAGRLPDFVSWHAYSNAPLLGPDGPEDPTKPASLFWRVDHGSNPVASPTVLGEGVDVVGAAVAAGLRPGEAMPALIVTEWNLSSGGLDHRHDTYEGAAHALASLIEMQGHGLSAATFFTSVDRHCADPAHNPSGADACGDWGTATISGQRKPVWFAFDLWNRMAGRTVAVAGDDPASGFWALASGDGTTLRILLVSFSSSVRTQRRVTLDGLGPSTGDGTIRRIDPSHPDGAPEALAAGQREIDLPANSAALVELPQL